MSGSLIGLVTRSEPANPSSPVTGERECEGSHLCRLTRLSTFSRRPWARPRTNPPASLNKQNDVSGLGLKMRQKNSGGQFWFFSGWSYLVRVQPQSAKVIYALPIALLIFL